MATSAKPAVRVRASSGPRTVAPSPGPDDIQALPAFPPEHQHQQARYQPPPPPPPQRQQDAAYLAALRTPSPGPVPVQLQPAKSGHGQAPDGEQKQTPSSPVTPRRSSFSFLRRGKSVERLNSGKRSTSGAKLTKKQQKERDLQAQREAAMLPKEPPKLPAPAQPAPLQTFGGDVPHRAASSDDMADAHKPPLPPMPGTHKGAFVDPYARTESMTNRGRYSYASSTVSTLNSPRRIRRRKDPTPFNVLVMGAKNSGKTAFIDFLRNALALPSRKQLVRRDEFAPELNQKSSSTAFNYHFLETEASDGERVGLTIWDSEGLEKNVIDLQLREVATFLESKFQDTLNEELKVVRSPGARDTHIHAVFLLLDPVHLEPKLSAAQKAREAQRNGQFAKDQSLVMPPSPQQGGLGSLDDQLDLQVLRMLQGKTTVIPVISKADTVPQEYMVELKRSVGESLRQANLDPLESLTLNEEDDDEEEDSSEEEADRKRAAHRRHDSKKFDERDEDRLLPNESAAEEEDDRSNLSVLDLTSSSSSTSVGHDAGSKKRGLAGKGEGAEANLFLPLSVISPYPIGQHAPKPGQVGRKFAWGFADPYEPDHCDFVRLKEAVFREWRDELREASRELWYERWRSHRLHRDGGGDARARTPGAQPAGRASRNGAKIQAAQQQHSPQQQQQHPPQHSARVRTAQWPLA